MHYIKWFKDIRLTDVAQVGGNAPLGQMIGALQQEGIEIPDGFAVTAQAYRDFIDANNIHNRLADLLAQLDITNIAALEKTGAAIRALIVAGIIPTALEQEIRKAYAHLSEEYKQSDCDVAVRSSATAEDLPGASFAGQQETFLNIHGIDALLAVYKKCLASLFTNRAIVYRVEKGFDHLKVALSVGVQKMIRSDLGTSGVAFSLDTETGFKEVILINASYGLGETIVQGLVTPDEYLIHKPTLKQGFASIINKKLGDKKVKLVYQENNDVHTTVTEEVTKTLRQSFALSDKQILYLARAVVTIEEYYSQLNTKWTPMDIEWAQDGIENKIYIVQARPETVHNKDITQHITIYSLNRKQTQVLVTGQSIGQQVCSGVVRLVENVSQLNLVQKGDIIVTGMTDPDWVPAMKIAAGIVTNRGGRTCHAAIVSRELGIPAIIGTHNATTILRNDQLITLDCSQGATGYVYDGQIPFKKETIEVATLPSAPCSLMVNIANPDNAFTVSTLPVDGVGLARIEFIIGTQITVHPLALIHYDQLSDASLKKQIDTLAAPFPSPADFFVQQLAYGIGTLAAAFYPRPVLVRCSDFKSNEYRNLLGGTYFEPQEENPMLGIRGAFRYYHETYTPAFALECAAIKQVREQMGLSNVCVMIPFVRTVAEAQKVIACLAQHGLKQHANDLKIFMMCEVPANVLLIDQFSAYFDGFSIGSNDLAQLTLGVDRDSALLAQAFDERDEAVCKMMALAIAGAKKEKRTIGICGQAPSDYPDIADFLIKQGIDSISLNPDSVIPFLMRYRK